MAFLNVKKKNRLNRRSTIGFLLKRGKKFTNKLFLFKYDFSRNVDSQFAIIISKKISKKAVERNKLKRQISEALRLHLELINKPINCVIIPHKHILQFEYAEIEKQLIFFLKIITK